MIIFDILITLTLVYYINKYNKLKIKFDEFNTKFWNIRKNDRKFIKDEICKLRDELNLKNE
jgi:hypothetical protein